jgi:hypothetical protein
VKRREGKKKKNRVGEENVRNGIKIVFFYLSF